MFKTVFGNRPSQNMPAMQAQMDTFAGADSSIGDNIRHILAPINRADDAEIVIKRDDHARERGECEAIIAMISRGLRGGNHRFKQ